MEVKPGYKQTELGVIPDDWDSMAAEDAVDPAAPICYGVVQVGQDMNDGVPIIPIKYVKQIAIAPLHRTSQKLEQPYARSRVKAGDVLLSIKGTIGRVGIVPDGFEGNISRELARLRPKKNIIGKYLIHQLESQSTQSRINRAVVGTTRFELSIATLRQFKFPVPKSRHEQHAIASVLDDVDILIEEIDKLIIKKSNLKQAIIQQLLTGQRRLPGFEKINGLKHTDIGLLPVDWEVGAIKDNASIGTGNRNTQDRVTDGLYPFFVRSQVIERINSYSFDGEAVLTAGDGVGTGKVFHYINGRFDIHQRVYKIYNFSNKLFGFYFFLYFSNHFYSRIMSMTAKSSVDSVRLEMIANMPVPIPPVDEQRAIATVLSDMDAELSALEARRDKALALKQGMMQELLTGRTRLLADGGNHDA